MKLKNILLMGAIAIGMIACKNDDIIVENTTGEAGDAYVAFSIAMPNRSARAAGVDDKNHKDTYEGTEDEQAVKKVRVVLYDANEVAAYSFDFAAASSHGSGEKAKMETKALYITDAQKVVKQNYKVLVLLNPTEKVIAVTNVSKKLSDFEKVAEEDLAALTSTTGGFFMSNAQGLAEITPAQMKESRESAQENPFKDDGNGIKVDRAVAKVFVGGTPEVKAPSTGAKVEILGWKLDVTNKKLFWMRKFGKKVKMLNTFEEETIKDGSDRYNRYAMDPNFESKKKDPAEYNYLTTSNKSTINGNITKDSYNASGISTWNTPGYSDEKGEYAMENTMQPWLQYESVTTRAIIKAKFTPKDFTEGESWYSFDNIKISKEKFMQYVEAAKHKTRVEIGEPTFPTGLKEAIQAVTKDGGHDFSKDEEGESYVMTFNMEPIFGKKLKFYKNAECYYAVMLRHFDDTQSSQTDYDSEKPNKDNGYGRYGVVRNNIYKLNLASVTQPGDPIPDEPDEDTPDDKREYWLSVKTEIMPWFVRVQNVDL